MLVYIDSQTYVYVKNSKYVINKKDKRFVG